MRRRPVVGAALAGLVLVAAALALGGCSRPDPHVYDKVNAVADSLGLSSIGTKVYEGRYGTGQFSDSRPTLIWVISGSGVKAEVDQALVRAGYTPHDTPQPAGKPETWGRVEQTRTQLVSVTVVPAGTTFQDAEQKDRTVVDDSVEVFISS